MEKKRIKVEGTEATIMIFKVSFTIFWTDAKRDNDQAWIEKVQAEAVKVVEATVGRKVRGGFYQVSQNQLDVFI